MSQFSLKNDAIPARSNLPSTMQLSGPPTSPCNTGSRENSDVDPTTRRSESITHLTQGDRAINLVVCTLVGRQQEAFIAPPKPALRLPDDVNPRLLEAVR